MNKLSASDFSLISNENDIDKAIFILTNVIHVTYEVSFPLQQCSRKRFKDKKWLNKELKDQIKMKKLSIF